MRDAATGQGAAFCLKKQQPVLLFSQPLSQSCGKVVNGIAAKMKWRTGPLEKMEVLSCELRSVKNLESDLSYFRRKYPERF